MGETRRGKTWIGDAEGDGLLDKVTKFHCIVLRSFDVDKETKDAKEKIAFVPQGFTTLVESLGYSGVHCIDDFPSWCNKEEPKLVFHYGEGYDYPAMKKIWGWEPSESSRLDSLVLARMDDPNRDNSIAGWGRYFKRTKPTHEDWSQFSLDMLHRCDEDTYIGWRLVRHILANTLVSKCSKRSRQVELDMFREMQRMKKNGIYLRREVATRLLRETQERANEIAEELNRVFPPLAKSTGAINVRVTKGGELHKRSFEALRRANEIYPVQNSSKDGEHQVTRIEWKPFNPGSPQDRVRRLQAIGWTPTQYTPAGQPSFTEDSVVEALHKNEPWFYHAKILRDWLFLDKRAATAKDWLERADEEGYIHHTIHPIGTRTTRGSHTDPNLGNITKYKVEKLKNKSKDELLEEISSKGFDTTKEFIQKEVKQKGPEWVGEVPVLGFDGKYGWECRDSFGVKDTRNNCLVGVDAASMQLRALAHYSNDEDYIKRLVTEDPHLLHAEGLGILDNPNGRAISKTFIYAWLLGAGLVKQGIIISEEKESDRKKLLEIGKEATKNFKKRFPFIEDIQKECRRDFNRGYVKGIDGRLVNIKYLQEMNQPHKVLSVWLQEFEASIMKHAAVSREKINGEFVGWIPRLKQLGVFFIWRHWVHDEYQVETRKKEAEEVKKVICESLKYAGELLHSKCPIDGDGKIGLTWAETH